VTLDKAEKLADLAVDINLCKRCRFCGTRDRVAISRGDARSPLMIVSDYPRQADNKSGEAVRGRTGKKLDNLLERAGMKPEQVYVTSLLKCWPGKSGHFPEDNGPPSSCFPFLVRQIQIVNPVLVVLAGPEPFAWALLRGTGERLGPKGEKLLDWVGPTLRRRDVYGELRFMVIPNPSLLVKLKNDELDAKVVKALETAKEYIVSRQKGTITPHIEVVDIKPQPEHSKKDQLELFKWTKPPEKPQQPPTQ
jgi:uracil-DNA glycosylase family 4